MQFYEWNCISSQTSVICYNLHTPWHNWKNEWKENLKNLNTIVQLVAFHFTPKKYASKNLHEHLKCERNYCRTYYYIPCKLLDIFLPKPDIQCGFSNNNNNKMSKLAHSLDGQFFKWPDISNDSFDLLINKLCALSHPYLLINTTNRHIESIIKCSLNISVWNHSVTFCKA